MSNVEDIIALFRNHTIFMESIKNLPKNAPHHNRCINNSHYYYSTFSAEIFALIANINFIIIILQYKCLTV